MNNVSETQTSKENSFFSELKRLWLNSSDTAGSFHLSCGARTKIFILLLVLAAVFMVLLSTMFLVADSNTTVIRSIQAIAIITGFAILVSIAFFFQRDFLHPLAHLRKWVFLIRGGDLKAQIPLTKNQEFTDLAENLNAVGVMLLRLSEDFERQIQKHTKHITEKSRSLQILYNLSASTNYSTDLDELLSTFLNAVGDAIPIEAAAIRLLDGSCFRLVNSVGLEEFEKYNQKELEIAQYHFSNEVLDGKVVWEESVEWSTQKSDFSGNMDTIGIISIPLMDKERTLGVFNLFVDMKILKKNDEMNSLMRSIGQHCGMAIAKARLDAEAHRLKILEEREHLSHELHDSLAQTLVSLRFQIRVLDDSLEEENQAIFEQLERIESTVDEANTELRELITHFRAPIDKRGVMVAVQQLVRRFQEQNDISVFLQREWPEITLPGDMEIHILRIIQESLVNIRKHSQASTVRIFMRGDKNGSFSVLIEDDGKGFEQPNQPTSGGEHIGFGIMHERANKIGGHLNIDSESGEGTRIELQFDYPAMKYIQRDTQNPAVTR